MPIPALAIASGIPLAAALAKYITDNPQRAVQKATEALELASGVALSTVHPWYGAVLATKAATRLAGLQHQYPSKERTIYRRPLENVYARSFRNAQIQLQRSSWRRKKIWNKRKIWNARKTKKRSWRTKRTWKTSHHAKYPTKRI